MDEDTVRGLKLNAGLNVLVLKVVNEGVAWQASVRVVTDDGKPVPGLRLSLN